MRFIGKLLLVIVVALLIAGLLTYPAWTLISHFADYRPDRVTRRIGTILLAIGVIWILRRERLIDRATFGYGVPRDRFIRQLIVGFVAGLLLMVPLVVGLIAFGVREWSHDVAIAQFVKSLVAGTVLGFAVSFLEETLFRGAMFSAIRRESGTWYAMILPSLLFAAGHFLFDPNTMRFSSGDMNYSSGLWIAAHAFADFATPLEHVDAFAALFALAILLSLVRLKTESIAASVGLHAGGVAVIFVIGDLSTMNPQATPSWVIPSYNHVVGWLLFAWISVIAIGYWVLSRKRIADSG
ncbi:MAG TPA: type II CAAX endopeptidase family protein [Steroidobacteraceae bacterium]|nr:type II CAAX endopeptidase family protein [Steroidobacteraceae bacterium]